MGESFQPAGGRADADDRKGTLAGFIGYDDWKSLRQAWRGLGGAPGQGRLATRSGLAHSATSRFCSGSRRTLVLYHKWKHERDQAFVLESVSVGPSFSLTGKLG